LAVDVAYRARGARVGEPPLAGCGGAEVDPISTTAMDFGNDMTPFAFDDAVDRGDRPTTDDDLGHFVASRTRRWLLSHPLMSSRPTVPNTARSILLVPT
jgi:hypothetical protein